MQEKSSVDTWISRLMEIRSMASDQKIQPIVQLIDAICGDGVLNSVTVTRVAELLFKSKWLVDYYAKYAETLTSIWQPDLLNLRISLQSNDLEATELAVTSLFNLYFFKSINDILFVDKLNAVQKFSLTGKRVWAFENTIHALSEKTAFYSTKVGDMSTLAVTFSNAELTHTAMSLEESLFDYIYAEEGCKQAKQVAFLEKIDAVFSGHMERITKSVLISDSAQDRVFRVDPRCRFVILTTNLPLLTKMHESFSSNTSFMDYCWQQLTFIGNTCVITVKDDIVAYLVPISAPAVMPTPVEFTTNREA